MSEPEWLTFDEFREQFRKVKSAVIASKNADGEMYNHGHARLWPARLDREDRDVYYWLRSPAEMDAMAKAHGSTAGYAPYVFKANHHQDNLWQLHEVER